MAEAGGCPLNAPTRPPPYLIAAESDVPLNPQPALNPRLAVLDTFHACCVAAR